MIQSKMSQVGFQRLLWVSALGVSLIGCQGSKKSVQPPLDSSPVAEVQSRVEPPATAARLNELKIRVVAYGKDRESPLALDEERGAPSGAGKEFVIQGTEMIVNETIEIGRSKGKSAAVFLVWPEAVMGSVIETAYYQHRIQDAANRIEGDSDRIPASYDFAHHRWFISLERVFRGHETELNPTDLHWITFDFLLQDRTRHSLRVGFRFMGPPPALTVQYLEVPASGLGAVALGQEAARSGRTVAMENWTNPTDRKLTLWIRPNSFSSLRMRAQLSSTHYDERPYALPDHSTFDYYDSWALFRVNAVQVTSQGTLRKALAWSSADQERAAVWEPVEMKPHETLTLAWNAVPQAGTPSCAFPATESRPYHWNRVVCVMGPNDAPTPQVCSEGGGIPYLIPASGALPVYWSWISTGIEGAFGREVRVTEPSVSPAEAQDEQAGKRSDRVAVQIMENASTRLFSGEAWHLAHSFGCQGVF